MNRKYFFLMIFFAVLSCDILMGMDSTLRSAEKVFLNACKNNKLSLQLIDLLGGQKVNFKVNDPENDFTGLNYLCYNKNFELLKIMLAKKIYTINEIFFSACETHALDENFINFVISHNGSIDAVDPINGYTGLHYACLEGSLDVCKLLLDKGAEITVDNEGNSLLQIACAGGLSIPLINFLIESRGFDINGGNDCARTALHYACVNAPIEIVQLLLDKGAKQLPDIDGETPLHVIRHRESQDDDELISILRKLLDNDKSILNVQDNKGRTPLHVACEFLSPEIVCFLLQNGAEQIRDESGESPLDCSQHNETYKPEIIQYILKQDLQLRSAAKNPQKSALQDATNSSKKSKKSKNDVPTQKKKNKKKKKKTVIVQPIKNEQENLQPSSIAKKEVPKIDNIVGGSDKKECLESALPKKSLLEHAQAKAIKMITGQDEKAVIRRSYAATVSPGDAHHIESPSEEKKPITIKDHHVTITIPSQYVSLNLSDNAVNQVPRSQHVIEKMNNSRDYLHNFSSDADNTLLKYAQPQPLREGATMYTVPVTVELPSRRILSCMYENIISGNRVIHAFLRPDKKSKRRHLLLPSCEL